MYEDMIISTCSYNKSSVFKSVMTGYPLREKSSILPLCMHAKIYTTTSVSVLASSEACRCLLVWFYIKKIVTDKGSQPNTAVS